MIALFLLCALAEPGLPLTTVAQGPLSSIDEPRQVVVRTPAEWERLWLQHSAGVPVPAVDFATKMVVGVFLGSRPTAGYKVEIVEVAKGADGVTVTYREQRPAPDRMVAQMLTAPFHLVSCDRQDGAVRFVPQTP